MKIKILCPQWGHEHLPLTEFIPKVKEADYDGVDVWIPEDPGERDTLFHLLETYELDIVAHQHQAHGESFDAFKSSFEYYLNFAADANPLLINSHTGKDYFTFKENCELIEIGFKVGAERNLRIAHETHRGRFPYSPGVAQTYFDAFPDLMITADLSHWCNVSESFLEGFPATVAAAIDRAEHVHARVGHTQSAQVPDPRVERWQEALEAFLGWWDRIVESSRRKKREFLTFTTEFGPAPYMVHDPQTDRPIASQWDINCYMKDLLRNRYPD